jgi:hypothetical protein
MSLPTPALAAHAVPAGVSVGRSTAAADGISEGFPKIDSFHLDGDAAIVTAPVAVLAAAPPPPEDRGSSSDGRSGAGVGAGTGDGRVRRRRRKQENEGSSGTAPGSGVAGGTEGDDGGDEEEDDGFTGDSGDGEDEEEDDEVEGEEDGDNDDERSFVRAGVTGFIDIPTNLIFGPPVDYGVVVASTVEGGAADGAAQSIDFEALRGSGPLTNLPMEALAEKVRYGASVRSKMPVHISTRCDAAVREEPSEVAKEERQGRPGRRCCNSCCW